MSSTEQLIDSHSPSASSGPRANMDNSTSSSRPAGLTKRSTSQGTRQGRPNMERQPAVPLDRMQSSDTINGLSTIGSSRNISRRPTAQESVRAQQSNLQQQQTNKKAEERYYVDNDYYSLNPWYERDPPRPIFGLGRPFPRTVRPGMLWGQKQRQEGEHEQAGEWQQSRTSGRSYAIDEMMWMSNQDAREDHQDVPILQISPRFDEHGQHQPPPDKFEAEIDGRKYMVTRIESGSPRSTDDTDNEGGVDREYQYQKKSEQETHYGLQSPTLMPDRMGEGFHNDHPPLDDSDSVNEEAAHTEAEKQEMRQREEDAIEDYYNTYRNPLARFRARYPEALSEFLATTIYLFFGIAGTVYSITYPVTEGDYVTQSWAWGLAVTAGIYVGGGISGSHMNPWISISFSIFRGFPWKMCLVYCMMQILAGFAAGALAWFIYRDAILHIDPDLTPSITGKALYTIPQDYVSVATAFFNDYLSAALYTCIAFAIGDDSNTPPGSGLSALIYGLMSFLLCICFGYNGLGVSPARDLGPRFVAWWVGYGSETFSSGWWAYGPIAAGLTGVLTGALVYDVFIFVGGESPVNYNWPSPKDVRKRIKERKEQVKGKGKTDKLDV